MHPPGRWLCPVKVVSPMVALRFKCSYLSCTDGACSHCCQLRAFFEWALGSGLSTMNSNESGMSGVLSVSLERVSHAYDNSVGGMNGEEPPGQKRPL